MSTLYENIKYYCDKANISGAKLCADCGISKSTLTSLKQGRTKKISADNLYKMANRLGVTVDDLLAVHRPHIIIGGEKHESKRMQPEWFNWEKVFENYEMVDFGENEKDSATIGAEQKESPTPKGAGQIPGYENLNDANKVIVQTMIAQLLAAQSND